MPHVSTWIETNVLAQPRMFENGRQFLIPALAALCVMSLGIAVRTASVLYAPVRVAPALRTEVAAMKLPTRALMPPPRPGVPPKMQAAVAPESLSTTAPGTETQSSKGAVPLAFFVGFAITSLWAYMNRQPQPVAMMGASGAKDSSQDKIIKTDAEWKQALTPDQFYVLRQKGTEPPRTGKYDKFYPTEGYFVCAGCGNPLYSAAAKFDSGCGWPAFDKCYQGSIKTEIDESVGMKRIEIMCAACDSHLGHVFEGEGWSETMERHCVNSVSVKYVAGETPSLTERPVLK